MNLIPRSMFGRNILLIVTLIAIGQLVTITVVYYFVQRPRTEKFVELAAMHVATIRAALESIPAERRADYMQRLESIESTRVIPYDASIKRNALPADWTLRYFVERFTQRLGASQEVSFRDAPRRELMVRISAGGAAYWVGFYGDRLTIDFSRPLFLTSLVAGMCAFAGALLIQVHLNRPMRALIEAAEQIGHGLDPPRLDESGPAEIAAVSRGYNQMAQRLAQAQRDRTLMLAGISHDLRSPLARIRLGMELHGAVRDPDIKGSMERNIQDMDAIIDQFLDFARGDAGETEADVALNELVREVAGPGCCPTGKIAFELEPLPTVAAQPVALSRLLSNLLANACAYGGGDITVRTRMCGDRVVLSVLDRGPGIPADETERLRQPFARASGSRSGHRGAGLGLAIVDAIAKRHDGELMLLPREGGGLEARVELPVRRT